MLRFKWQGDGTIEGETPEAVIRAAKKSSPFTGEMTDEAYMVSVATRAKTIRGAAIRTDAGAAAFLADLEREGFIVAAEPKGC